MADDLRLAHRNRILAVKDLPTLPKVLEEVTRLVADPNSSTDQVAKLIAYDQVLSAKVLKMVNSPIYGFPGRIGSIQHALVLLGLNVIKGVIISTSVFDFMISTMNGLWEHSLGCALACTEIAKVAGLEEPEEYSVPGLLHDLGKVVTAVQLPDIRQELDATVKERDCTYREAEALVIGFTHEAVNGWLAQHWRLPLKIREGMAWHHAPTRAEHYPAAACVVHLADFLVKAYEYGFSGDDQVPYLDPNALKILKLDGDALDTVMDALAEKFLEVADISFS
ncbi:HDOD domain-containing protein [Megalodesulfovibrio gigas]|uniref:Putative sugnal transduction protein n=1 Tax=Megalodesulfovibrio gigas (strain ATCC 19364 / DSM 1382 / NCIMB 9332 / VKM B-1759) TaxID=1121448 RepID=T2G6Y0_MEGG1|nr:HDOD domain-containing protein [Megalodesulfovibrio gigas]AGW11954.1 putative sugnal transduction protein [Megalodesulfovibrio gigas DSM 1382 = ATCC 19364]